jgi:hypothetical protein
VDENVKPEDVEAEATIDDLDVPAQDAADVVGGVVSNVQATKNKTADAAIQNVRG